jgi:hypothetical protein
VDAHLGAQAQGTGSARLRIDSQGVVADLLDRLDAIPEARLEGQAQGTADLHIDNVAAGIQLDKRTRGILVAIPVASTGLHFFAGAKEIEEYVVASVQGFDYQLEAQGTVTGSSSGTGGMADETFQGSEQFSTQGRATVTGAKFRRSWKYTMAVIGLGFRGEHGGFHVLADLDWAGSRPDTDGFLDLGVLPQLKLPGNLGDLDVGGDFEYGGFSAGVNVKLLSFTGHAIGGRVDLFLNQKFSTVELGLSYKGQVRGLMADQTAALQVSFYPTSRSRLTLVAGIRVLSSYTPGFSYAQDHTQELPGNASYISSSGPLDVRADASASASFTGSARIREEQGIQNKILYYPGMRLDLLDSRVSVGGGPILDQRGQVEGGHASVAWEVVPDRITMSGGLQKSDSQGTSGGINMNVLF